MDIVTYDDMVQIRLGAHSKSEVFSAARRAADMWRPGIRAEVTTILGDVVFWITPMGTRHWRLS